MHSIYLYLVAWCRAFMGKTYANQAPPNNDSYRDQGSYQKPQEKALDGKQEGYRSKERDVKGMEGAWGSQ